MRKIDLLYITLIIMIILCWVFSLSSFHQTARYEQLKHQSEELAEFQEIMRLASKGDEKALDNFMRARYGEVDYCTCVPWSEKMIKKMGPDIYHGTKRTFKMLGGN